MSDGEERESEERGFRVVDRRGERAEQEERAEPAAESSRAAPVGEPPMGPPGGAPEPGTAPPSGALPRIDFATFVLSLGTSALYHLGLAPDPASGEPPPEVNLPLARQTIDTLEMLQEKTRGNLDTEESHLLESLLYELRMRCVESSK